MNCANEFEEVISNMASSYSKQMIVMLNADDSCNRPTINLIAKILDLRLNDKNASKIVVYSFKSFQEVIKNTPQSPRVLVSPKIYFIQLPAIQEEIKYIFEDKSTLDISKINEVLDEYCETGSNASKNESVIAHTFGNILGPEKLLYSAFLCNRMSLDEYKTARDNINKIQKEYYNKEYKSANFLLYRVGNIPKIAYNPSSIIKSKLKGKLLFIDDHAHLGWSEAISSSLSCKLVQSGIQLGACHSYMDKFENVSRDISIDFIYNKNCKDRRSEIQFYLEIIEKINDIANNYDAVITDLRLCENNDENSLGDLSGIKLIKHVKTKSPVLPMAVFTASRKAYSYKNAIDSGADAYLIKKPIDGDISELFSEFENTIQQLIGKSYISTFWNVFHNLGTRTKKDKGKILDEFYKIIYLLSNSRIFANNSEYSNTLYAEIIINLDLAIGKCDHLSDPVYCKKTFDGGHIIRSIRNFLAHSHKLYHDSSVKMFSDDLTDLKICLYSFYRYFFDADADTLCNIVKLLFSNITIINREMLAEYKTIKDEFNELVRARVIEERSYGSQGKGIYIIRKVHKTINGKQSTTMDYNDYFEHRDIQYYELLCNKLNVTQFMFHADWTIFNIIYSRLHNKYLKYKIDTTPKKSSPPKYGAYKK